MRFVNLTVSSVPIVLHYQSIRPDFLFTWNSDISSKVKGMKEIVLNKYLRFEDHTYLPSSLDKIRIESQKDMQEFGFSQLKLVIAFLNWHNLKEDTNERIQSPLLLIPVELKKIKRLKEDHYSMKILDNDAEVNPVIANQLKELYGIKLPDFVDLDEMSLNEFYKVVKSQIDAANQGIQFNYIDKPKIKLVHSVAKQTVTNFKRRLRKGGNQLESYKNISYSYQTEHYKPLGLEIFKQRIEHRATFLEYLINDDIKLNTQHLTGMPQATKERELYEMVSSENNPYSWDFDTCNIVLGNFNYKKMSLVRDYNHVIDNHIQHSVFNDLFNNKPKQVTQHSFNLNKPSDWYHVITADPTQTHAILQSRTGESYIIQGPPGTGKSQTITNLIADFVARDKSILFVCEKRAALDVVFHRLKQSALDELCCYIHDSQGDKRAFIKNLKNTYEDFSNNKLDVKSIQANRKKLLHLMYEKIEVLQQFHSNNTNLLDNSTSTVRSLIERLIAIQQNVVPLQPKEQELLPNYSTWEEFGEVVQQLSKALEETGADAAFAEHPFSNLPDAIFVADSPLTVLDECITNAKKILAEIQTSILQCDINEDHTIYLQQIKDLIKNCCILKPLAKHNNLALLNTVTTEAKEFDKKIEEHKEIEIRHQQLIDKNKHWRNKFSLQDAETAIIIAQKNEKSIFSFLNGNWRKLKKQLIENYDFTQHQVKPSYSTVLQQLQNEYAIATTVSNSKAELQKYYQVENIENIYSTIEMLRSKNGDKEITVLLSHHNANNVILKLALLNEQFDQLENYLQKCIYEYQTKKTTAIKDELENIEINSDGLQELLPSLKKFIQTPSQLKQTVRNIAVTPLQAEAIIANKNLQQYYLQNKEFANTDFHLLENAVTQIKKCYKQLLKVNAEYIRASIRKKFNHNVEISNTALSQLNAEQKQFKKSYNEGRKILENEFGKSMRYKSIRELSAKESRLVLKDIKPIWLMSPLSVSDSLPLDTNYFDVVIFDEASQITLEEGIPALFRSSQTIIVGDDKQMPPTNFFTSKVEDPDDLETFNNEDEDELLSADADSLLVQGSRKLNSTMLSWHYRSHYETLISYSNHAFYEAGLLTIPDKTIHNNSKKIIEVITPEDALQFAECLFDRSISFHYLPNSVYEKRNNQAEANYIAHVVRSLLKKGVKESIGIVAFSQEQQNTIEDALTALAQTDSDFEALLEAAYNRTEDDQFIGLIIKNLENIQGDERDIIIMSVCYGFDSRKKMIMNFGPINKKGGEKRLNVIFSRAKKHMAIVSSIKHFTITNEYNEGANYFKRFLHYAESVSSGNMEIARTILDSLVVNKNETANKAQKNIVLMQIKQQLQKLGYQVAEQVGHSTFKCSLAVKENPDDNDYTLSILLDDDSHYRNTNLLEQYYQRPAILQSFGWRSINVYAKDWLQNSEKVIQQIIKKIKEVTVTEVEEETTPIALEEIINTENPIFEQPVEQKNSAQLTIVSGFEDVVFERYIFTDSSSNKFWEAGLQSNKLIVRFGRVGTKGQIQVKTFDDIAKASKEKEKLVKEKIGKGYKKID